MEGFDNLIPLCGPCNKKFLKKETDDGRPAGFLERFYLLLGYTLRPQISGDTENGMYYLIPASEQPDGKGLISWEGGKSVACTEVFTQSFSLTQPEAKSLVQRLVNHAKDKCRIPPRLPYKARLTEMTLLAQSRGRKTFWQAGQEFLNEASWIPDNKGHEMAYDSWQPFADNFYNYEHRWRQRIVREHAEREMEKQRELEVMSLPKPPPEDVAAIEARRLQREAAADRLRLRELRNKFQEQMYKQIPDDWQNQNINVFTDLRERLNHAETIKEVEDLAPRVVEMLRNAKAGIQMEVYPDGDPEW